jgi:tetratricopeptide (TPR) repeat protein
MHRHRTGDFAGARELYHRHLTQRPDDAPAWCLLAALEGQGGDHDAAGAAFRKAIVSDPAHAPGHAGLGTSLLLSGDPAAAVGPFREALRLQPGLTDTRAQLALVLHRLGRLDAAIDELRELVRRCPDDLQALRNLGMALLDRGDAGEARDLFAGLLERWAELPEAWIGLAGAQMQLDHVTAADDSLTRALELMPAGPAGRTKLGALLGKQGRQAEARRCFEAALDVNPAHVAALASLAEMDRAAGNWRAGLARIEPFVSAAPGTDPLLMTTAASLWVASGDWPAAERRIATWLEDERLPEPSRAHLERLRGEALDRLDRHDAAWQCWTDANRRSRLRFDPADFERTVDALIAAFDRPVMPEVLSDLTPRPLLIVGLPRSGKSILEQLLACHRQIHGAGERRLAGVLTERARIEAGARQPYPACVRDLDEAGRRRLAAWYAEALGRLAPTADWVTDSQPTNYLHLGLLHGLRPDLRVVYCRREPLDLAWDCFTRGFAARALAFAAEPAWIGAYLAGMERLMAHWTQRLSLPVLTVDYESLVTQPESETRRVLGFLDLDWDPACADYVRPGVATLSASAAITRPLDRSEIGRSRPYREQLAPVVAALGATRDR